MSAEGIVSGQKASGEKLRLARELRRRMTPEERIRWKRLRAHRLQGLHFRRQQITGGFIVDLNCHAAGLIVEVDGGVHEGQAEYDAERDRALAERGLRVLHIGNEDVGSDIAGVLARIVAAAALALLGPSPMDGRLVGGENQPNSPAAGER